MMQSSPTETQALPENSCLRPSTKRDERKRQLLWRIADHQRKIAALERELSRVELGLPEPYTFPDEPPGWLLKSHLQTVESEIGKHHGSSEEARQC